ncbi:hypothetical protein NliqN6_1626 [Naganishia liquefaciens]|uniref:Uncharacterized protein n=1 Tax=Naganishia liquefaciens TaxID=104408 RepID=A0A8H3YDE5_9TREE|nr:hypothetical protein NliqN6_1626 [Naganishia liquefaciens]
MVLLALEVSSWQPSQVLQIEYVFLRSMREATAYGGLEAAVGVQDDSRIESLQLQLPKRNKKKRLLAPEQPPLPSRLPILCWGDHLPSEHPAHIRNSDVNHSADVSWAQSNTPQDVYIPALEPSQFPNPEQVLFIHLTAGARTFSYATSASHYGNPQENSYQSSDNALYIQPFNGTLSNHQDIANSSAKLHDICQLSRYCEGLRYPHGGAITPIVFDDRSSLPSPQLGHRRSRPVQSQKHFIASDAARSSRIELEVRRLTAGR